MDVRGSLQLGRGVVEEGEGGGAGAGQIGLGGLAPSQPGERECRQIQLISCMIMRLALYYRTCRLFFLGPILWCETRTIWTDMFEGSLSHVKWIVNKKSEYTLGRPYRSCIFSYSHQY